MLCTAFSSCGDQGATLCCDMRASHCGGFSLQSTGSRRVGFSSCGSWAPDAQAQQLWLTGLVAPRHVGSSRPGLEPVSPALAGGFLTTAPPGKPGNASFKVRNGAREGLLAGLRQGSFLQMSVPRAVFPSVVVGMEGVVSLQRGSYDPSQ